MAKREERGKMVLTIIFTVICIAYIMPILIVLINSFKSNAAVIHRKRKSCSFRVYIKRLR